MNNMKNQVYTLSGKKIEVPVKEGQTPNARALFASSLKKEREKAGLTESQLANKITYYKRCLKSPENPEGRIMASVDYNTVKMWENPKNSPPSFSKIKQLCNVLPGLLNAPNPRQDGRHVTETDPKIVSVESSNDVETHNDIMAVANKFIEAYRERTSALNKLTSLFEPKKSLDSFLNGLKEVESALKSPKPKTPGKKTKKPENLKPESSPEAQPSENGAAVKIPKVGMILKKRYESDQKPSFYVAAIKNGVIHGITVDEKTLVPIGNKPDRKLSKLGNKFKLAGWHKGPVVLV